MEQGKERQQWGTNQGTNNGGWGTAARARGRCRNLRDCGGSQCCTHRGSGDNEDSAGNLLHVHDAMKNVLTMYRQRILWCCFYVWGYEAEFKDIKERVWSYFGKNVILVGCERIMDVWFCNVSGLVNRCGPQKIFVVHNIC